MTRKFLVASIIGLFAAGHANAQDAETTALLNGLQPYKPEQKVSGLIRNYGFGLGGVLQNWEDAFRKIQPDVTFKDTLPTSDAAIPALATGQADLGPDGGEPIVTESLVFYEVYGYDPTMVIVASGAFDAEGKSNGPILFVHKSNPINQLSMKQLDGIFGAERNATLHGFVWSLEDARGPEENIRTWGQLGLTGEWANKEIQTYGHAPSGTTRFFQWKVLKNSDKWNPNYRGYAESDSKMIDARDKAEQRGGLRYMFRNELAKNPYGIAWAVMPQAKDAPDVKPIAIQAREGGPFVYPSKKSFQDRSYPMVRNIYMYLNRKPGAPVDPKLKEFLRFVLSRDGQELIVKNGGYLPLPASVVQEQLKKLD